MSSPYDTPPGGDFARYVERLGQPEPVAPRRAAPVAPRRPASRFAPLQRVLQWGLMLYVGYLMLSAAYAPLRQWGGPLALAFGVFAFLRLRKLPWRALAAAAERQRKRP